MKLKNLWHVSIQNRLNLVFCISLIVPACFYYPAAAVPDSDCGEFFSLNTRVAVTGSGNYFAAADPVSGIIGLFENDGTPVWGYRTGRNITSLTISDDCNTIAAASNDGSVFGFDKRGDLLWRFDGIGCYPAVIFPGNGETGYIYSNDGSSGIQPYTVRHLLWNGTVLWGTRVPGISDASVSRDGKSVVLGTRVGRNSEVLMYSDNGTRIWSCPAPDGIELVSVSADGSTIGAVHTYRLLLLDSTGKVISEVIPKYHTGSIAISPDGNVVATGSGYMAEVFDRNGNVLWQRYEEGISGIAIPDNNQTVITGSQSGLSCYDYNGTRLWVVPVEGGAGNIAVSDDGNTIIAGSGNSTVCLLDHAGGIKRIPLESVPLRHLPSRISTRVAEKDIVSQQTTGSTSAPLHPVITVAALGGTIFIIRKLMGWR